MSAVSLRQLLQAGVHFGHQTSRWNPKMRPYIFAARNGLHIIDLEQTQKLLDEARDAVRDLVGQGGKILFVGTKKQAQDAIKDTCERTGQFYVTHRWMGGMLTNFPIIQRRLKRLVELRAMNERGDFHRMSGKEANAHRDDLDRLERNFSGMVAMKRLPAALFIVDCKKERLAVSEAAKLGIPIIALADSNVDPEPVRYVIPGNDDAMRSVRLIVDVLAEAIIEGQQMLSEREFLEQRETAVAQEREQQEREQQKEREQQQEREREQQERARREAVDRTDAGPAGGDATESTSPQLAVTGGDAAEDA